MLCDSCRAFGIANEEDVKEGVIAARIAAHAADLARGNKNAWEGDLQMAQARVAIDLDRQINVSIDPDKSKAALKKSDNNHQCAVCRTGCATQVAAKYFGIAGH